MTAKATGPIRCPSCGGRGKVGSSKAALRSVIGRLREDEVGDPKLFEQAKSLYLALSLRTPSESSPPNGSKKTKGTAHTLAGTRHLGPWKWEATCSCGTRAERGTKTAATNEILRHVAKEPKL